jgi:hypothetical protein
MKEIFTIMSRISLIGLPAQGDPYDLLSQYVRGLDPSGPYKVVILTRTSPLQKSNLNEQLELKMRDSERESVFAVELTDIEMRDVASIRKFIQRQEEERERKKRRRSREEKNIVRGRSSTQRKEKENEAGQ